MGKNRADRSTGRNGSVTSSGKGTTRGYASNTRADNKATGGAIMRLDLHHISAEYCELSIDEIHTGTLNLEEAKELALHLIYIATELLEKEA
jgi:hypothetical protein